jgi:hypothetical protein
MDLRRLRAGEILLAVSGLVLLVSLFLPWYDTGRTDLTGWEALGVVDVLLALVALSAISVLVATTVMRVAAGPISLDALVTLVGLIGLVLVLFRVLFLPDEATGRGAGLWLALAGVLGMVAGATLSMRDERLSPSGRHTDATGRPIAAPPEIQLLPAPPPGDGA